MRGNKYPVKFISRVQAILSCKHWLRVMKLTFISGITEQYSPQNEMDYLRVIWGLDQTRVGFYEYYESGMPRTPAVIPKKTYALKTELLKLIPFSAEINRSGKSRLRYRAIVAVGDGNGKLGIGSCTNRSKKTALSKAENLAKQNMIELKMASHPSTPGESHTLAQIQKGSYKQLEVTLTTAPRGTGLMVAPMAKVVLKLARIEDCLMCPQTSEFDSTSTMAFGLFATHGNNSQ